MRTFLKFEAGDPHLSPRNRILQLILHISTVGKSEKNAQTKIVGPQIWPLFHFGLSRTDSLGHVHVGIEPTGF